MEIRLENLYADIGAKRVDVYEDDRRPKFRTEGVQSRE